MSAEVSIGAINRITNNLVNITNQTLDSYTIGSITPAAGTFTTLTATTTNGGTITGTFNGTIGGAASINNGVVYCATATGYASTTTLQAINGLSIAGLVVGTYKVMGYLPLSGVGNAQGIKVALTGANSLALTTATVQGWLYNGSTIAAAPLVTALSGDLANFANTATHIEYDGTIVVSTGGTLQLSAAQHSSSATTATVGAGGYMQVTRIS